MTDKLFQCRYCQELKPAGAFSPCQLRPKKNDPNSNGSCERICRACKSQPVVLHKRSCLVCLVEFECRTTSKKPCCSGDCSKIYKTFLDRKRKNAALTIEQSQQQPVLRASKKQKLPENHGPWSEYRSWVAMKRRCYQPKDHGWARYGGRGIGICDRWLHGDGVNTGYECFLKDMGPKPSPQHTLDRYPDNDGWYQPGNCRWATWKEQGWSKIGIPLSAANRVRLSRPSPNKGKHLSEEQRRQISLAKKGKKLSPAHRAKLSAIRKGKPGKKGRPAWNKGITHTPETRRKISTKNKESIRLMHQRRRELGLKTNTGHDYRAI